MQKHPQILADIDQIHHFSLLANRKPFSGQMEFWRDSDGYLWAIGACEALMAIPLVGEGWHFDLAARTRWRDRHTHRLATLESMSESKQEEELRSLTKRFRFGPLSERLAWTIHREILRSQQSCAEIPDTLIRDIVWDGAAPSHWRSELGRMLSSLSLLHVAKTPERTGCFAFGDDTAVLTHFKVRSRGDLSDCTEGCPLADGKRHTHVLVNVGRGFLGCLEGLAENQAGAATRHYQLEKPSDDQEARQAKEQLLRRVGKAGTLTSIYLPAVNGSRKVCNSFSPKQRELLQVVFRERTRATKKKKGQIAEIESFQGQMVAAVAADRRGRPAPLMRCEFLDQDTSYVGFNGNGKRRGRGYKVITWTSKAYYEQPVDFLEDLVAISERLELIIVGIDPSTSTWVGINELCALAHSRPAIAGRCHVRVYAKADCIERWNELFRWNTQDSDPLLLDNATVAKGILIQKAVRQAEAAQALGIDPSAFGKMLKGKRRFSDEKLQDLRDWITNRCASFESCHDSAESGASCQEIIPQCQSSMISWALEYRRRGWSILPQLQNAKQPVIKWKRFQSELPSESEIMEWWSRWPEAGIILIAGELSGVLVVDVDSQEAEEVLLDRLGETPLVPTAKSGSQDPHRFHLFFQHPAIPTKAKSTPWHPKLEFRGNAGLVVLPPSLHKSGNSYRWQDGRSLNDTPLAPVPPSILEALKPAPVARPTSDLEFLLPPREIALANSTREFLAGKYAQGPGWNDRLFRGSCPFYEIGAA